MIIRTVELTLDPAKISDFLTMFERVSSKIRNQPGCKHLELWQNVKYPNIVSTFSHWDSVDDLNNYRHTELFIETWKLTKSWFVAPPRARSQKMLMRITDE